MYPAARECYQHHYLCMSYTPVEERAPVYSAPTSSPDVVANTTTYVPTKADYLIFEVLGPTAEMLPSIIIALVITAAIVKTVLKKLIKNQPARAIVATILFSGIYYFMFHSLITASSVYHGYHLAPHARHAA